MVMVKWLKWFFPSWRVNDMCEKAIQTIQPFKPFNHSNHSTIQPFNHSNYDQSTFN